jgi:hypothetical protein
METVEILHYKWCIIKFEPEFNDTDFIIIKDTFGRHLIYCKVERFCEFLNPGVKDRRPKRGIRTVPVKREEMEKI